MRNYRVTELPGGELKQKLVAEVCRRIAAQELEEVPMARFLDIFESSLSYVARSGKSVG